MKKISPIFLLGCVAMLNAAELKLEFDKDGNVQVGGVAVGALPGGFSVKERIFKKAQPEVILAEDFQNENRQSAMGGGCLRR